MPAEKDDSRLIKLLMTQENLAFDDPDEEYRRYLRDHREHILMTSEVVHFTDTDNALYQYAPSQYLRNKRYPVTFMWYVLWLNQIRSCQYFTNITSLYLPNTEYINTLYARYRAVKANIKKYT